MLATTPSGSYSTRSTRDGVSRATRGASAAGASATCAARRAAEPRTSARAWARGLPISWVT